MLRGINRQNIFECDEDHVRFLEAVAAVKEISDFELFGYCLMGNHVHLLLKTGQEPLGIIFKRIGVRYVSWFNRKYVRSGHLFQGRFKSEPVEDSRYLLAVLRYIHNNPVKAGLCRRVDEYRWSSCRDYIAKNSSLADTTAVLTMLSSSPTNAAARFMEFMQIDTDDEFLDVEALAENPDDALRRKLEKLCGISTVAQFQALPVKERNRNIRILRDAKLSIRQISRMTGIPFGIVRSK
jgi:REP element-mobilizing transposase RayT